MVFIIDPVFCNSLRQTVYLCLNVSTGPIGVRVRNTKKPVWLSCEPQSEDFQVNSYYDSIMIQNVLFISFLTVISLILGRLCLIWKIL